PLAMYAVAGGDVTAMADIFRLKATAGELRTLQTGELVVDAVARQANVSRITVYQFNFKAGSLEALFDQLATTRGCSDGVHSQHVRATALGTGRSAWQTSRIPIETIGIHIRRSGRTRLWASFRRLTC